MNRHSFPIEFQKVLLVKDSSYTLLVKAMSRRGYRVSKQFICAMALGQRAVPPQQLRRICEVLGLDEDERRRLHKAACLDNGYDLGTLDE